MDEELELEGTSLSGVHEDIELLNALLRPDVRFRVSGDRTAGVAPSVPGARGAATHALTQTGILEISTSRGLRVAARIPLLIERHERRRRHILAGCLAECAMQIGLGMGVYGRRETPPCSRSTSRECLRVRLPGVPESP